ncbi:TetR/AcrR family transcriptional regulator [Thermomonospora umbrina]|uniref:TetR family transcriptional regulator n=1 Tax=Thermomonospora umbrina TaxID=111806 RepID=A0A3D9T4I1_9ACTN|nr:TetR/AcrR family transcriptional regulator [Thermomonospora umbrina]REE98721.1 TetR family transcriptional regulator [Thermomonospora umbrina]
MVETRRDRLRAATVLEITQTARRLLVDQGQEAMTLRAIAREMGMTAPALYRYFDSHSELLAKVVGDIFNDLTDDMRDAIAAVPPGDLSGRTLTACRTFRRWGLAHPREYALLFGTPTPALDVEHDDFASACGLRFAWTFLALFVELWERRPFPILEDGDIAESLRGQLERFRASMGFALPLGAALVYLQCWVRLHGNVSLEVMGHLDFALDDPEPLFELLLSEMSASVGLVYGPPE